MRLSDEGRTASKKRQQSKRRDGVSAKILQHQEELLLSALSCSSFDLEGNNTYFSHQIRGWLVPFICLLSALYTPSSFEQSLLNSPAKDGRLRCSSISSLSSHRKRT